jgi:triosephosphate isomerase
MKRTNYTIANWKMNGSKASKKLVKSIINHIRKSNHKKSKVIICPPFTLLSELKSIDKKLLIGAQDCHQFEKGAYTGSISSQMLRDIGCKYVILGHSERREYQNETSKEINLKIKSAIKNNLVVIYCIGEKLDEIKKRNIILKQQLNAIPKELNFGKLIIAYEPVWAIGTGKTPKKEDINLIHKNIRNIISKKFGYKNSIRTSILYGGSVTAENSREILNLEQVDGALVGGASLKLKDFCKIIDSYS